MLARSQRLRESGLIQMVLRRGKRVDLGWAKLYLGRFDKKRSYNQIGQLRAAVIVSKKVSKKATVRNQIKRKIYEQLRLLTREQAEVYDIVIVVRQEVSQLDSSMIYQKISRAMIRDNKNGCK
ncbi:ribonuclease P protein component [Candidatus Saccharibacteria bacterium]|nr:ribonuclease P protein component [Candidatus Saccharibacteria bacterium]MCB9834575.1 ribonuclease P protein component [Candidatus Nomurabacteria bacterium]